MEHERFVPDPSKEPGPNNASPGVHMSLSSAFSRRRFLQASVGTAGVALLAACGGDDDDAPGSSSSSGAGSSTATAAATQATATSAATSAATPAPSGSTPTAAATSAATQVTSGGKKTFRMGSIGDILNIDPAHITDTPDYPVGEAIFNQIARYTYDPPLGTEMHPELAESWDVSDDATTYTFHLVQGAMFHRDYGELTAETVKWNWERIQNPDTGSRYATDFAGGVIDVVDEYTVKVTFEEAYPAFIRASLGFRPGLIISPEAMEELGDEWKTNPVGTGAFMWSDYQPGARLTLVRNPDYWGTPPVVDEIIFNMKLEDNSALLAVSTGELDAHYTQNSDLALQTLNSPPPNTTFMPAEFGQSPYWIAFNMKKPPLDDVRVRHALRYAIDVEAVSEVLFGGLADPIHSFLPPFMFGYSDDITKFNYDPERAKALLEEAADVIPENWTPVMLASGVGLAVPIFEVVSSWWIEVGVTPQIDLLEPGVVTERRRAGDYDMFGIGVGRIEPDQIATPYWHGDSPPTANNSFYSDANDLIEAAKSEPNEERRAELYRDLQDKISQDSPAAFIIAYSGHLLINNRVTGIAGSAWQNRIDWFNVDVPAE